MFNKHSVEKSQLKTYNLMFVTVCLRDMVTEKNILNCHAWNHICQGWHEISVYEVDVKLQKISVDPFEYWKIKAEIKAEIKIKASMLKRK